MAIHYCRGCLHRFSETRILDALWWYVFKVYYVYYVYVVYTMHTNIHIYTYIYIFTGLHTHIYIYSRNFPSIYRTSLASTADNRILGSGKPTHRQWSRRRRTRTQTPFSRCRHESGRVGTGCSCPLKVSSIRKFTNKFLKFVQILSKQHIQDSYFI